MSKTDEIVEPSNEKTKEEQLHRRIFVRNLKIFQEFVNAVTEVSKEHEQTEVRSITKEVE